MKDNSRTTSLVMHDSPSVRLSSGYLYETETPLKKCNAFCDQSQINSFVEQT